MGYEGFFFILLLDTSSIYWGSQSRFRTDSKPPFFNFMYFKSHRSCPLLKPAVEVRMR